MKLPCIVVATLATSLLVGGIFADEKSARKEEAPSARVARQTSADQMVQNILKWLQGVYTQQSRRSRFADYHNLFNFASDKLDDAFRQGTLREYLPPTNTQKPRPFETARPPGADGIDINGNYINGGYPPAGSITPQPPFPIYTRPAPGVPTFPGQTPPRPTGYPTGPTGYPTGPTGQTPPRPTGYPTGPTGYPTGQTPPRPTGYPTGPTEYPTGPTGQTPPRPTGYPTGPTGYPTGQTPPRPTGYPTGPTEYPTGPTGQTPPRPTGYPTGPTGYPAGPTDTTGPAGYPTPGFPTYSPEGPTPGGFTESPSTLTPGFPTQAPENPTPGDFTGYPGSQTPPTPAFPTHPAETPSPGDTTGGPNTPTPGFPTQPPETPTPGGFTGYPSGPSTTGPTESTQPPTEPSTGYPERPGFPTQPPSEFSTGYPEKPGFPTQAPPGISTESTERPGASTQPPSESSTGYPERPTQPPSELTSLQPEVTTQPPSEGSTGSGTTGRPALPTEASVVETETPTSGPSTNPAATEPFTSATTPEKSSPGSGETPTTQSPEVNTIPSEVTGKPGVTEPVVEDDDKHPPHIHALDVECAKDMMTINIEFNREFNGIIYSKGFYSMPECRYVKENSGQTKYTFTVNLNMCGTEFINAFDTQGQSYLENILVLQNEAGIQEVWDTVRAVRCLWEGNLKETLSVALSVGMLSQELVTFSGDTAVAKLDILLGRGALGQPANGLVKIGEPMTLVVSVSGDPGFDIQVKDCRATDSTGDNTIPLTDEDGCVLKPKLFGAFQKTRSTGDTGASIIAYAYFNAFKFPDVMDLMIECNIELCKTDCDMCTDPNQKLEPGRRRRRDLYSYNETLHDGVTMGKHLRIILPEDLSDKSVFDLVKTEGVCMSTQSFVFSTALMISLLTGSCLFSAYLWLKTQHLKLIKK